jgi:hypothetical protein
MNSTTIIGYAYDADLHCVACATDRFKTFLNDPDTQDSEGNPVHPAFADEGWDIDSGMPEYCGDCGEQLAEYDTTYSVNEIVMGAVEREEVFYAGEFDKAAALFTKWAQDVATEGANDYGPEKAIALFAFFYDSDAGVVIDSWEYSL